MTLTSSRLGAGQGDSATQVVLNNKLSSVWCFFPFLTSHLYVIKWFFISVLEPVNGFKKGCAIHKINFPCKCFLTSSKCLCPCGYIWYSNSEVITRSSPGPSSFFQRKYSKISQGHFLQIFIKSKLEWSQMVGMGNLFWVKILLILRENINLHVLQTNLTREIIRISDSRSYPDPLTQKLSKRKHSNLGFLTAFMASDVHYSWESVA